MSNLYPKRSMLFKMLFIMLSLFGFSATSLAKTEIYEYALTGSYLSSYAPALYIDKCVITTEPYFVEQEVNRHEKTIQCADYDDMKAFAEGKIKNFHVYTVNLGSYTRANMRAYRTPDNLKQGNVWVVEFRFTLQNLSHHERQFYYASDREPYQTYYNDKTPPFGFDASRFEHLTTVDKLISGTW